MIQQTVIEIVRDLKTSGKLGQLIRAGFMSDKIATYYEMWLEVDKRKQVEKKKSKLALSEVAEIFGKSERTVERAVKIFNDENRNCHPYKGT